jgi:hypothetical protein
VTSAPLSLSPWQRLALVVNGGLALTFAVVWAGLAWHGDFWKGDFTAYYTGWSLVWEGRADDLYDRDAQVAAQARLLGDRRFPDDLLSFINPPHSVVPLALLALLPLSAAFHVWALLQAIFLLLVLRWAAGRTAAWGADERLTALAALLAFPPLFITFQLGQLSLLLLLGLCGLYLGLKQGRPWVTACCLALLTVKPQVAILPAALLVGGRRWRELAFFAAVMAAWAGLTTALLGWRCWLAYPGWVRHISAQVNHDGINLPAMVNLRALLTAWLPDQVALVNPLSAAALLLATIAVVALWRGPWRPQGPEFDRRFALTVVLTVLCSLHTYRHDALLLALPALLAYDAGRDRAGAAFFLAAPALFAVDTFLWRDALAPVQPLVLLLLAWAAVLVWLCWRGPAAAERPAPF